MRELVRCAHDKRFKHVARIKLVIDGIEVQARLLGRRSCRQGIILRAKKLKMRVVHADFDQNRLQQLTVSFREPLSKYARRDSNHQLAVFRAFLACGAKPCGEAMRINPPLHVL